MRTGIDFFCKKNIVMKIKQLEPLFSLTTVFLNLKSKESY